MPAPDATPTPPPYGLFGHQIKQDDNGQFREQAPDGGFIIWQLKTLGDGRQAWSPVQHVPPPKGTEL